MKKFYILIGMMLLIFFASLYISNDLYNNGIESNFQNKSRYILNDDLCEINNGNYVKSNHKYVVFDINGEVIFNNNCSEYVEKEKYNLNEVLQFDKSYYIENEDMFKYSFILSHDNITKGFALFYVSRSEIENHSIYVFLPIIIVFIIFILLCMFMISYVKKHMLLPVLEINKSAKAIMEGDYNVPICNMDSLKENEAKELTYNFELMRDELKNKIEKEEILKKNEKELISCISHDLKTPVSTIKAYAEGLLDNIANTEEKKHKYEEIILYKTEVIVKMINDLLDHSNAELGELKIEKRELDIKDYFNSLMKEIEVLVNHNNMSLEYNIQLSNNKATIDEDRMTQVVYNIVENAIKYNDKDNGTIKVNILDKYENIYVSIWDNGKGISCIDVPYIFDKFYRAEKSRSMRIPGSGLGLSICKYIIENHDGNIICHSKLSQYTKIEFYIKR